MNIKFYSALFFSLLLLFVAQNVFAQQKLGDNLGTHAATKDLQMQGFQLLNTSGIAIGQISVTNGSVALEVGGGNKAIRISTVVTTADIVSPLNGMIVYTTGDNSFNMYQNGAWAKLATVSLTSGAINVGDAANLPVARVLTGDVTLSNTGVSTIEDLAVTQPKLAIGAVSTTNIADLAVTNDKLAVGSVSTTNVITGGNSKVLGTDNLGEVTWIDQSAITPTLNSSQILVGSVTNTATAVDVSGDVTISSTGVTAIGTDKVLSSMILDGTVSTTDLADALITNEKLAIGSVSTTNVITGGNSKVLGTDNLGEVTWIDQSAITPTLNSSQILVGSVTNTATAVDVSGDVTISSTGVTAIGTDKVLSSMILDGTVSTTDLADALITNEKLAIGSVSTTNVITGGNSKVLGTDNLGEVTWIDQSSLTPALNSSQILVGNVSNTATAVDVSGDVTISSTGVTAIGTDKVLSAMILDGTVSQTDLAIGAVSTTNLADFAVVTSKLADSTVTLAKFKTLPTDANKFFVTNKATGLVELTSRNNIIPQYSTLLRDGLISPTSNDIIFNTDTRRFEIYDSTIPAWIATGVVPNENLAVISTTVGPTNSPYPGTADVAGSIISNGLSAITSSGFVWVAGTITPTFSNSAVTSGSVSGNFTGILTDLTANTLYSYRAYAINSQGPSYGTIRTVTTAAVAIPTLSSTTIQSGTLTYKSVTAAGNVLSAGGAAVTETGVIWTSTIATPLITDGNKLAYGVGIGSFAIPITGLTPSTVYYLHTYAINSAGPAFGAPIQITTPAASEPQLSATTAITVSNGVYSSGGTISDNGGVSITAKGVVWSTTLSEPTITELTKTTNGLGAVIFTSELPAGGINELAPGTAYNVRAYATNISGLTGYGPTIIYTTPAATMPVVSLTIAATVNGLSAITGGTVSSTGTYAVTTRGVVYGPTASTLSVGTSSKTTDGSGVGTFNSTLTNLASATTYHARAYATSLAGTAYGPIDVNFTTPTIVLATVTPTTAVVQTAGSKTVTTGGNVTLDGNSPVTERGIVWSTISNPIIGATSTTTVPSGTTGTGPFSSTFTYITPGVTHYVKAYAITSAGPAYGPQVSFLSNADAPVISASSITTGVSNQGTLTYTVNATGVLLARGVVWSQTNMYPLITGADSKTTDGTNTGTFTGTTGVVTTFKTWYVRAYATNSGGTTYGPTYTFGGAQYVYTGTADQQFVVPVGVTSVRFDAYGAGVQGGTHTYGALVTGIITVSLGETYYINIGGMPSTATGRPNAGGFNGGGAGGGVEGGAISTYSRGGAGATDVRVHGNALTDRIIVAGGAGGYGQSSGSGHTGGNGGLINVTAPSGNFNSGPSTVNAGQGGTQSAGGAKATNVSTNSSGLLGFGGNGPTDNPGGGAGGGYYGGGGAGGGGGGGGSSWIIPSATNKSSGTQATAINGYLNIYFNY